MNESTPTKDVVLYGCKLIVRVAVQTLALLL